MSLPDDDADRIRQLATEYTAEELEARGRALDGALERMNGFDVPEHPVGEDGLTADERRVCLSVGCEPQAFLRMKAAFRGQP